ncbi:putative ABC transporter ATP-binding protein [Alphaproteobacteria bacterium]
MLKLPSNVFAFLYFFVRQQYLSFSLIAIVSTISVIANNSMWPYITGELVDSFSKLGEKADVMGALGLQLGGALALWVFIELVQRSKGFLFGQTMPKFEANIRTTTFNYVLSQPYSRFFQKNSDAIAYRIDDLPRSSRLIIDDVLSVFLPLPFSIILSSSIFFHMHFALAAVFLVWLVSQFIFSLAFCYKAAQHASYQSEARASVQANISDVIKNNLSVRLFNAHGHEKALAETVQSEERKRFRFVLFYIEKSKLCLSLFSIINVIVLFYIAIKLWQVDKITTGDVVFVINSTLNILVMMWFVADEITYVFNEVGTCKRGLQIVTDVTADNFADKGEGEQIVEDRPKLVVTKGEIEFINVGFRYHRGRNLFRDKCLIIPGGQKVGLVGFSGSGKTTFVNLIMKLYDLEGGKITIDKQDISAVALESLRRHISFIPQSALLFNRSIKDNIRYGNVSATEEEIMFASIKAHCHEFVVKLDRQYDAVIGEKGVKLSGGQDQRILIARAILKDASILVMDEATSALDSITEKKLQEGLEYLMAGKTVIVIAHRLSTIANMDRILVFDQGVVVEDGTHEELLKKQGHYALLCNLQRNGLLPDTADKVD